MKKILSKTINNGFKNIGPFIKKNIEVIIYLLINIVFLGILFGICFGINAQDSAKLSSAIQTDAINVIIPVGLAIITIIISVELLVRQLFFKRLSKRYFYHTGRNICAIFIFFVISILLLFNFNEPFSNVLYLFSPIAMFIEIVCFAVDLTNFDANKVINKLYRAIIKQMDVLESPYDSMNKLYTLLRDFLMCDEQIYVERIIRIIPKIYKKYLDKKHEADSCASNPFVNFFEYLHRPFYILVSMGEDPNYGRRTKYALTVLSSIVDESIRYGNEEIEDSIAELVSSFNKLLSSNDEWWVFFVNIFLPSDLNDANFCYDKVLWLSDYYDKYGSFNDIKTEPFVKRLVYLLDNKKLIVDENILDVAFALAPHNIFEGQFGDVGSLFLLQSVWDYLPSDLMDSFISKLSFNDECYEYFDNINDFKVLNILHRTLDYCFNNPRDADDNKIREIQLSNLTLHMHFTKKADDYSLFELTDEDMMERLDQCKILFGTLSRVGGKNDIYYGIEQFNDYALSLASKDEDKIKKVFDVYGYAMLEIEYSDPSSEKVDALSSRYYSLIENLDEQKLVSEKLADFIIDDFFEKLDRLIDEDDGCAIVFANKVSNFEPFACNLGFINGARKTKLIGVIANKVYCSAIRSIEKQRDEVICRASNYLGWSSFYFMKDNNLSYRNIINKYALPLFRALISLKYNNNTIYFVSTLFVIILSYALIKSTTDPRHIFAAELLKKFSFKELIIIKEVIVLRKDVNFMDEYFEEGYDKAILNFEKELEKRIVELKN